MHLGNGVEKRLFQSVTWPRLSTGRRGELLFPTHSSCTCFRFMLRDVTEDQFARRHQECSALYEQVVQTPDSTMTELPGWDGAAAPCLRHTRGAPAVNEGLQAVRMINGLTSCYVIHFIWVCLQFEHWRHDRERVKTIWKSPQNMQVRPRSGSDHTGVVRTLCTSDCVVLNMSNCVVFALC